MVKRIDDREGEVTVLTVATSNSKSLRATVPIGIVRQFRLKEGDELHWQLQAQNGDMIIIVKPMKQNGQN